MKPEFCKAMTELEHSTLSRSTKETLQVALVTFYTIANVGRNWTINELVEVVDQALGKMDACA